MNTAELFVDRFNGWLCGGLACAIVVGLVLHAVFP